MHPRTIADLIGTVLGRAGVSACYGEPLDGMPVVVAQEPPVAEALSKAHQRVTGSPAALHLGGGELVVDPGERGTPEEVVVGEADDLAKVAAAARTVSSGGGLRLTLAVDPVAPVGRRVERAVLAEPVERDAGDTDGALLERIEHAPSIAVLAGPGVARRGADVGLRSLAAQWDLGVLNTWGAKGVFHWQSRHHWATVGLQSLDFELSGLDGAAAVLAVGLDERESPVTTWSRAPLIPFAPEALVGLGERVEMNAGSNLLPVPPLRTRLAELTQSGWRTQKTPIPPTIVTRNYSAALSGAAIIAADAGTAGFWVARTVPTQSLRTVLVPAERIPGWAVASVAVARLSDPWRPALAVVDGPLDDVSNAVLDFAGRRGIAVGIESWDESGGVLSGDAHLDRLWGLVAPDRTAVATIRTDGRQLEAIVEAAGEVVAWR